jgi:choice-of-anchor B domain-containing protein
MFRALTRSGLLIGAVAFSFNGSAVAHDDDPKYLDDQPPYTGPGYRRGMMTPGGFDAVGVNLEAWITILDFDPSFEKAMDCWGYVSPSGREYGIVGLSGGTAFVEITDPGDPVILDIISGPNNGWRDIKVYQHYAYIVAESTSAGVQVVDMGSIDKGVVTLVNTITGDGSNRTHNIVINEDSGYMYRCGGSGNGLRIYSLDDPVNPAYVGEWPDRYVHDAEIVTFTEGKWAGREIAFTCGGFNGGYEEPGLDVLDVTDKTNIVQISRYLYPDALYSHQAWLTDDARYLYLNDEFDERDYGFTTNTHIIDVSDLENPFEATTFTNGLSAIDHNLYIVGDLLFESNYRSGLRIFDASERLAPVEIGYFDTYPEDDDANYNGLWSNYPFFPSGTVIGSDKEKGMFIWSLDLDLGIEGDVNGDGVVDTADLVELLAAWGDCPDPPEECPADVNEDGIVDTEDLLVVLSNWG